MLQQVKEYDFVIDIFDNQKRIGDEMNDLSKHFGRREFTCKCGCTSNTVDAELIRILERIRDHFQRKIIILSGCRCYNHNKTVGGSENSYHITGKAADFYVKGIEPKVVVKFLRDVFFGKYGVGLYNDRVHLDVREGFAKWDKT